MHVADLGKDVEDGDADSLTEGDFSHAAAQGEGRGQDARDPLLDSFSRSESRWSVGWTPFR
jgi:hypothetical protein